MTHTDLIRRLIAEGRPEDARIVGALAHEVNRRDALFADALRTVENRVFTEVRLYREDSEDLKAWFTARLEELDKEQNEE